MTTLTTVLGVIGAALLFAMLPKRAHKEMPAGEEKPTPKPLRGTWLVKEDQGRQLWEEELAQKGIDATGVVPFGNGFILPESESKHVKIIGTTGTGKSMTIKHLLARVAERPEQRVVIADLNGSYAQLFYRPERGDRIVNPFDGRDCGWDIAAELTQPYHAQSLSRALIPTQEGHGAEWSEYAQKLVAATLTALQARGDLSVGSLYETLSTTPPDEYAELIDGTPAAKLFAPDNEKFRASVEAIVSSNTSGLQYMHTGSLSLNSYARSDTDKGWIFVTYTADQIESLRTIIAAMLRVVIFSLMSRPEEDSGTWLIIDELDALGKIDGLQDALTRLRKFGGRCVLGFQSLGPLVHIYGPGISSALIENCRSTLLLCSSAGAQHGLSTCDFAAKLVGEREVLRTERNTSKSTGSSFSPASLTRFAPGSNRGTNAGSTTRRVTEPAVMPSQIEQLPDLHGFVHSHDSPFWSRCTIEPYQGEPIAEAFVPRPTEPASASTTTEKAA